MSANLRRMALALAMDDSIGPVGPDVHAIRFRHLRNPVLRLAAGRRTLFHGEARRSRLPGGIGPERQAS